MADTGVVLRDGLSILPEPIRHHILSFLTPEEAAKTSVLSKLWLSTCRTRPNLHFVYKEGLFRSFRDPVLGRRRDFINCIDTTLLRYHENKYGIDTLVIRLNGESSFPPDPVNAWLQIAVENGVKSLKMDLRYPSVLPQTIFEAKSLEKLCLCGNFQLKPQVIKIIRCYGLRKLHLFGVELDELMLERIMSSCPFIESLKISFCVELVNVKVTKLQKLKRFSINLYKIGIVQVEAPNLEDFSYSNFSPAIMPIINSYDEEVVHSLRCLLYMNTCKNLKKMVLYKAAITDKFFLDIAENFPHLEELTIHECGRLRTIKISSHSIKRIHLKPNRDLKEVRIDVLSIDRFEYRGDFIPLFSFAAPTGPWVSDIELSLEKWEFLANSLFSKLNDMFTKLSTSEISLRIDFPPLVESFIENEMRNSAVFPLPQVQNLTMRLCERYSCPDAAYLVLDGIFWSCRPKTIVQHWYHLSSYNNNAVVKALFERLMLGRNQNHCNLQQPKFWLQDLKDVKFGILRKGQRVHLPETLDWQTVLKLKETGGCDWCTFLVFDLEWETDMNRKSKRT